MNSNLNPKPKVLRSGRSQQGTTEGKLPSTRVIHEIKRRILRKLAVRFRASMAEPPQTGPV